MGFYPILATLLKIKYWKYMHTIGRIKDTHILLLQGPIGFFFKRLDKELRKAGAKTYRIGFNMGDSIFSYGDNYTPYRATTKEWRIFVEKFVIQHKISKVFLFGDCRFYQKIVIEIAKKYAIEIYVFEEGYVRPHYITLEKYGVNGHSHLPKEASFYHNLPINTIEEPQDSTPNPISNWSIVIAYYFIAKLFHSFYKNYKHHREYSASKELFFGLRSLARKVFYTQRDKKYLKNIQANLSKKYFFIPLQTHNDFQILQHSHYGSLEKFIIEVLESFAKYAPKEYILLFKHHPIDRGRKNYTDFITDQAKQVNIETRILILHDIHLPTCLKHAKGTVTINSTVGFSSLYHKTPAITLGNAIYDIEGLTAKNQTLKEFWQNPSIPDIKLFNKYKNYIIQKTQLNGSFYGQFPLELQEINL
ncbi:Capsular polysaccharide export system protein KpsS [hydrothermal vent metagenome]|uniref:Capsular polysaccharide export system protein KpsS n=1 Tax=hydrothermal vent metagenome TaxID=652676 RepID=A0A1W1D1E5_9ZZZZ